MKTSEQKHDRQRERRRECIIHDKAVDGDGLETWFDEQATITSVQRTSNTKLYEHSVVSCLVCKFKAREF